MKDKFPTETDTLGSRIKFIRKTLGIKQEEFAKSLGFSSNSFSEYETGKVNPGFDCLLKLVTLYNASLEFLFFGNGEPFKASKWVELDDIISEEDFGHYTPDVKELFWYIRNSRWALSDCINHFREFLYRNREGVDLEIKKEQTKKQEGKGKK